MLNEFEIIVMMTIIVLIAMASVNREKIRQSGQHARS